jgi:S1-C subfamily serine protease
MRHLVGLLALAVASGLACSAPANTPAAVAPKDAAVQVIATGCRGVDELGAGLLIAPGRVLTAAHVVAGATAITIRRAGSEVAGDLLAFDPVNDLAVVGVDATLAPSIPLGKGHGGDHGTVVVFRDELPVELDVSIRRPVTLRTYDISGATKVSRPGFELSATIVSGDSGGVVVVDGAAVAVLWARSRAAEGRAWAIDPVLGGDDITSQLAAGTPVDSGACLG